MKAQAQEVFRIAIDEKAASELQDDDAKLVFPLNDEHTRVVELERVSENESEDGNESGKGYE